MLDARIRQFLSQMLLIDFGDHADGPNEHTNLFESGHIDSFGFVQLVAFLETEFAITITEDELLSESLSSFSSMRAFVAQKIGQ